MTKGAWVIRLRELVEELQSDFPGDSDAEMAIVKIGHAEAYLRQSALEPVTAAAPQPCNPEDDGA